MRDTSAADPLEALAREKSVTLRAARRLGRASSPTAPGSRCRRSTCRRRRRAARELLRPRRRRARGGRGRGARGDRRPIRRCARSSSTCSAGITRGDEVARGILAALDAIEIAVPIVVRLDGTNAEEGRAILAEAAPRSSTSSRRCSRRRGVPWSWPHERRLERARRAVPRRASRTARAPTWTCSSSGPRGARTALDVATGGGHVARRLREAGLEVVTLRPGPGMRADVIAFAEDLPFADGSFDLTVTRVAAHHFADVRAAVRELARVAADRVLVVDNLDLGPEVEEAERIRDPSHVRNYGEDEWRGFLADAGLAVEEVRSARAPGRARAVARAHGLRRRGRGARPRAPRRPRRGRPHPLPADRAPGTKSSRPGRQSRPEP